MTGHCKICNWAHTSLDVIRDRAVSEVVDKVSKHFMETHKDRLPEFKKRGQYVLTITSNLLGLKMLVTPGTNDKEDFEEKEANLTLALCNELGIEVESDEEEDDMEDEDEEEQIGDEIELLEVEHTDEGTAEAPDPTPKSPVEIS